MSTLHAPSTAPVGHGAPAGAPTLAVRVICTGLLLSVLLQRVAVPVGEDGISVVLVLGYAVLGVLLLLGLVEPDRRRAQLYVLACAACGVAAWSATWTARPLATMSYLLLVVVYVPWVFRLRPGAGTPETTWRVVRFFVRMMVFFGAVSVGQQAAQLSGAWTFQDYLAEVLPPELVLGDYNAVIPVEYASPVMKSQAFVFLEPSFLCQFLALGVLAALLVRAPLWQPFLMCLGMLATYSGTGIFLLAVGGVILLLRSPSSVRPRLVAAAAAVVVLVLSSPLAAPLLERSEETRDSTSSWSLRFVLPYEEVAKGLRDAPVRYLTGAGPGASERLLENDKQGAGLAVVYPVVPKVVFEYGVPAGGLFLAFWFVALLRGAWLRVLPGALVFMLAVLSGSLLQPSTIVLAWLLSCVFADD
ncbi:hypothetical protein [Nocardioides sp. Arc9.136]|uniref:hypothetical protein n=1 Tax=Nocardioides sp. Arc9.136 TaxID=2996826 RepID=UPI0026662623|nr:hypothetical protein [Nocardioides sp. Arc9.136]WKN48586.1 hypothetical protein OSR43_00220 [Nocardioides sp. Arc9.136]